MTCALPACTIERRERRIRKQRRWDLRWAVANDDEKWFRTLEAKEEMRARKRACMVPYEFAIRFGSVESQ